MRGYSKKMGSSQPPTTARVRSPVFLSQVERIVTRTSHVHGEVNATDTSEEVDNAGELDVPSKKGMIAAKVVSKQGGYTVKQDRGVFNNQAYQQEEHRQSKSNIVLA